MPHPNKILLLLVACLLCHASVFCQKQKTPLPADLYIDVRSDMQQYTNYVVPCIDWLQNAPLNINKKERARIEDFVLSWLQRNPDINISMPGYSMKFNGISGELLYQFMEGWIKYTLQTHDADINNCTVAGIKSMLSYYTTGKAVGLGKIAYLDNLAMIAQKNGLNALLDTTTGAKNTYIFLDAPPARRQFKHDENYFSFHFYCIHLLNPRAIRYRYLLDGYYDQWIETTDGSVTYPRLPPGSYTFKVQATTGKTFEKAVESSYSFTIARPFWLEYWFLTLSAAALLALGYSLIKMRENNLRNIAALRQKRILSEYEHLKSQVNPHFLFNSLNTLAHLIEIDQKTAVEYTENLSRLYQNILTYHDNDLVSLSQEMIILDNYLSIQKGRFGNALHLVVDIPSELMRTKKIVPLALQLLLENAIKHNVVSSTEPLEITITANDHEITVYNKIQPKLSKEKGEGVGLINITKRYGLLTDKPVRYGTENTDFKVILPLL